MIQLGYFTGNLGRLAYEFPILHSRALLRLNWLRPANEGGGGARPMAAISVAFQNGIFFNFPAIDGLRFVRGESYLGPGKSKRFPNRFLPSGEKLVQQISIQTKELKDNFLDIPKAFSSFVRVRQRFKEVSAEACRVKYYAAEINPV